MFVFSLSPELMAAEHRVCMPVAMSAARIFPITKVGDDRPFAASATGPTVLVQAEPTASISESLARTSVNIKA